MKVLQRLKCSHLFAFLTALQDPNLLRKFGQIPEWPKGSDCKSDGSRLRRFESFSAHHVGLKYYCRLQRIRSELCAERSKEKLRQKEQRKQSEWPTSPEGRSAESFSAHRILPKVKFVPSSPIFSTMLRGTNIQTTLHLRHCLKCKVV